MKQKFGKTGKKIFLVFALIVGTFFVIELSFRLVFAIKVNPTVLLFGTKFVQTRDLQQFDQMGVDRQSLKEQSEQKADEKSFMSIQNRQENYAKYFPNQEIYGYDLNNERFPIMINELGLRGRVFTEPKPENTIRIINLGASPTFGDENRDNETYSSYMEEFLNQAVSSGDCQGIQAFEVMNFGLPRLNSDQIYSLFLAEALPLEPDIITFYEGVNDTTVYKGAAGAAAHAAKRFAFIYKIRDLFLFLRDKVITLALIDNAIDVKRADFTEEDLLEHQKGRSEHFLDNLSRFYEECRTRGILFIVANQQSASTSLPRKEMKGVTFQDEVRLLREKLDQKGQLSKKELYFLIHNVLMEDLEPWVKSRNIPFVDVIEAMNQDRDQLINWSHLAPGGE